MSDTQALEAEFRMLYEDWYGATTARDRAWFERHLADDFRYITFEGGIWDRERLIDVDMTVEGVEEAVQEIRPERLSDDTVLVVGRYTARASGDASLSASMSAALEGGMALRWSAVWQRREEGWKVLLHHGTRIVDPV